MEVCDCGREKQRVDSCTDSMGERGDEHGLRERERVPHPGERRRNEEVHCLSFSLQVETACLLLSVMEVQSPVHALHGELYLV